VLLQLIDQVNVVARQAIGRGDQDPIQPGRGGVVAQPVEARSLERGPAVAIVAEDVVSIQPCAATSACRRSSCCSIA
jgi:hypothetical protein